MTPLKIGKWLALLPVSLIVTVPLAYLMAPIIATVDALFGEERAKRWFGWFDTPDNPLTGDAGHLNRHLTHSRWWTVCTWLWRNRAFGFEAGPLRAGDEDQDVYWDGDRLIGNRPLRQGRVLRWTPNGYFQWYYVRRNPLFPSRCIRLNLGWKLWDPPGHPLRGQYVCSINFFMGYSNV